MAIRKSSSQRGYNSRWGKARRWHLGRYPFCAECEKQGRWVSANVVDHIVPHRGDMTLFWDSENWQSLCANCHSSHKQRLERSGRVVGCDVDGMPLEEGHHWRK
jgi:5-methylcytosine-specific restriction protein A